MHQMVLQSKLAVAHLALKIRKKYKQLKLCTVGYHIATSYLLQML